MYVHVLYVCACIFQYAFPPDMPVRFSWRKACLRCCPPPSHDKSIFAGWSMYVCVCIACMCMYRMYVHVFFRMHCASQIFLEENMSKVLHPPSHYKFIFAGSITDIFLAVIACRYVYESISANKTRALHRKKHENAVWKDCIFCYYCYYCYYFV